MKLTFLGTGTSQGIPIIACPCPVCHSTDSHDKRLRASVLITGGNTNILIDAGPDFRQQMLRAKVKTLDAILITHEHRDHTAGLDDIRAFNYLQEKPMDLWGKGAALQSIQRDFAYVFAKSSYPDIPQMELHPVDDTQFLINGVSIQPINVMHNLLPIFGYRIGNLTYITDASCIPASEIEKIKGSEVFIINALRMEKHRSHFCLSEALEIIEQVKPARAFITHIGHQMGFHKDVEKNLPKNVYLAYDGLIVNT